MVVVEMVLSYTDADALKTWQALAKLYRSKKRVPPEVQILDSHEWGSAARVLEIIENARIEEKEIE